MSRSTWLVMVIKNINIIISKSISTPLLKWLILHFLAQNSILQYFPELCISLFFYALIICSTTHRSAPRSVGRKVALYPNKFYRVFDYISARTCEHFPGTQFFTIKSPLVPTISFKSQPKTAVCLYLWLEPVTINITLFKIPNLRPNISRKQFSPDSPNPVKKNFFPLDRDLLRLVLSVIHTSRLVIRYHVNS